MKAIFHFNKMSALYLTLIYLHIFISIALILLVIMQKTTGNGLFTSSQSNPFMSGSEMTSFITKLTVVFIAIFFINTLILAKLSYISSAKNKVALFNEAPQEQTTTKSVPLL